MGTMGGREMVVRKQALAKREPERERPRNIPAPPPPWRGSRLPTAKVTEDDVKMIRQMHDAGWTISSLSKKYGTTWLTMSKIVKGLSWKHVQ